MKSFIRKSLLSGLCPLSHVFGMSEGYAVLMYHRVVENMFWDSLLNPELSVRLGDFEKQMEFITTKYKPIPLNEMVQRISNNIKPDALYVSVTFDDGYADNWTLAGPVLQKYGLKAIVFVAAGYVEDNHQLPFWDELINYAKSAKESFVCRDIDGHIHKFNLETLKGKRDFLSTVSKWYFKDPTFVNKLLAKLSLGINRLIKGGNNFFTWDLLKDAITSGNYEIGCHTMTHPVLGFLDDHGAKEIWESKRILESKLQIPVNLFSYPFGGPNVTIPEVVSVVKKAGFMAGFTNDIGINNEKEDLFLLKRIPVLGGESVWQLKSKLRLSNLIKKMYSLKNGLNI